MNTAAKIAEPIRGKSALVRPRFSPGQLLRDDDLALGVDYTRELSRLLFRSLLGCGVVCGLEVGSRIECGKLRITVASGVALDGMGDPIHVPKPVEFAVDPTCGKDIPGTVWVTLCRKDRCCAPRTAVCGCDDEDGAETVCTREQEGYEIRLAADLEPDCMCACELPDGEDDYGSANDFASECWCADPCDPCYRDHYAGKCACSCGECVVLAVLRRTGDDGKDEDGPRWDVDHRVRRFVRPVLMRDPVVYRQMHPGEDPCARVQAPPAPPPPFTETSDVAKPQGTRAANKPAAKAKAAAKTGAKPGPG